MPSKTRPPQPSAHTSTVKVALLHVGALNAGERPAELLLLKWGRNVTPKGDFIVNERTLAVLKANQAAMRRPEVKGDFEHASVSEDPGRHPMKFGSEGTPEAVPGVGLVVREVKWTAAGIEFVPEHYSDLSAAPIYDEKTREVIGLHSYAHCRHGAADGATIEESLQAALTSLNARLAVLSDIPNRKPHDTPMDPLAKRTELLCALIVALGGACPENPSDEQLSSAVTEVMGKIPAAAAPAAEGMAELKAELATLSALVQSVKEAGDRQTKLKPFEQMREQALNEGRLISLSAEALMKLGETDAKAYIAGQPEGAVPLEQRTPAQLSARSLLVSQVNADEVRAFEMLGLTHPSKATK